MSAEAMAAMADHFMRPLLYALGCAMVFLVLYLLSPHCIHGFSALKADTKLFWWNKGTALLHAVVMFCLSATYWTVYNPGRVITPHQVAPFQLLAIDCMVGYMLYDTVVETFFVPKHDFLVLFHHIIGLVAHILAVVHQSGTSAYFILMVYLAEASTPFLHFCWLHHMLKNDAKWFFKAASFACLVCFFIFRILLGPYIFVRMLQSKNEFETEGLFHLQIVVAGGFVLLNFFWFAKLLSMAIFGPKKRSKRKEAQAQAPAPAAAMQRARQQRQEPSPPQAKQQRDTARRRAIPARVTRQVSTASDSDSDFTNTLHQA